MRNEQLYGKTPIDNCSLIIDHCFFGLMTEEEDEHDNIHKTAHKMCGLEGP